MNADLKFSRRRSDLPGLLAPGPHNAGTSQRRPVFFSEPVSLSPHCFESNNRSGCAGPDMVEPLNGVRV